MRASGLIGLGAAAVVLAAGTSGAQAKPKAHPVRPAQAASAERHGTQASYRTGPIGHGYSVRDRHIADCLASYRGYDPKTDRVVLRDGQTRRCGL
jgi:hypothetical protein